MVYDIDEQWQIDLVDLSKLSKFNSGYKFLLVCIDVLSKCLWFEPLKSKTAIEVKNALEKIFKKSNRKPKAITFDKGGEFENVQVKTLFKKYGIKTFHTYSQITKSSIVERVNKTLKGLKWLYFTSKNTRKYIDVLQKLVSRYNSAYHRSIKMAPKDVNKSNSTFAWINLYKINSK